METSNKTCEAQIIATAKRSQFQLKLKLNKAMSTWQMIQTAVHVNA
jgi:hypothetical protein